MWEEESVTQALLTKSARRAVIGTHRLVFVMTNEQIATSTFRLSGFDLLIIHIAGIRGWSFLLDTP